MVFKNLRLGFQKMSENRTGFQDISEFVQKVYYARIVKSALISALGAKYWRDVRGLGHWQYN